MEPEKEQSTKMFFVFLCSQLISLVGSKTSHIAIGFWIYNETRSVSSFSIILLLSFVPNIIGSFVSGPIVDRFSPRHIFGIGGVLSALIMLIIGLIFTTSSIKSSMFLPSLYFTIFTISIISAFQWVSLSTYISTVLKDEKLIKANGLLSTATSFAGLLAPSLASIFLSTIGMSSIFFIDAITYIVSSIIIIFLLPTVIKRNNNISNNFYIDFKNGYIYLKSNKKIFALVSSFVIFNFFAGVNTNLMTPLFIERYSEKFAGYLLSIIGFGSIVLGLLQTTYPSYIKKVKSVPTLMIAIFFINMAIGYISNQIALAGLLFMLGVLISLINTLTNLIIQEEVAQEFRGRIFATARGLSWICLPLAQIFCGLTSDRLFRQFFFSLNKTAYLNNLFVILNIVATLVFVVYIGKDTKRIA